MDTYDLLFDHSVNLSFCNDNNEGVLQKEIACNIYVVVSNSSFIVSSLFLEIFKPLIKRLLSLILLTTVDNVMLFS